MGRRIRGESGVYPHLFLLPTVWKGIAVNDWDDLEDDAKAASVNRGPRCGVGVMLDMVREEHGKAAVLSIMRTFKNVRLTTASIHLALKSRIEPDYLPSAYSLGRHRKGACSCEELGDE
jgi:hypothetical protein